MTAQPLEQQTLTAEQIRRELLGIVEHQATQQPRNLQVRIGPSGLGEPCTRRLAYSILEWDPANPASDPLPSVVGTGAHAMFAEFFERHNELLPDGRPRFLIEQRVTPRQDIPGSSDLFDRLHGLVGDWKFMGKTKLDDLRRNGPGLRYRVQSHVYGLGFENAGETVRQVAVIGVPRGGFLSGTVVWTEPYERQIALDALARKDKTLELIAALDVEDHPDRWALIPADSGSGCRYCPWFLPASSDLSRGCPGHVAPGPVTQPTPAAFLGVQA
jgi:hypothetical protein